MKKGIALLLSALMLLSAIPFAGAASFKDSKAITIMNAEAVDVMSDLKIIAGFPEGDFRPDETLTRAQAAKILCCVVLGTKGADALTAGGATFSDVPASHWANKFVEYCASKNIVAGVGDGKFDPNGTLSGYAFGKMLLVALGADASSLTGATWAENTKTQLHEKKLDFGDIIDETGLSRQSACRLALNALFSGEEADTLAYKVFGVTRGEGGNNAAQFGRPYAKYTSKEGDAYWKGTEKKITASPLYYKQTGAVKGGEVVSALGIEDITPDQMIRYLNGAKSSKQKSTNFHTGNKKTVGFTGDGVRFEVYNFAGSDKYTIVHTYFNTDKILSVVPAVIAEDGTVETPGTVMLESGKTVESNEFTTEDVGNYVLIYGTGKSRSKMSTPRQLVRGTIVSGKLTAFDVKKGVSIDDKEYKYFGWLNDTSGMKKYLENGGAIGDDVKILIDDNNLVYALWK